MLKKGIAEFIGTFVLVLFGTGAAVLGGGIEGIGTLGIAMAFGPGLTAELMQFTYVPTYRPAESEPSHVYF